MNNWFKILIILIIFLSCKNNEKKKVYESKIYRKGVYLIKEDYYENGVLRFKKHFTLDTVPMGSEITYYPNSKIAKWKWFGENHKYAYIGVYYDSNGFYNSFKGTPFIQAGKSINGETFVELVNPPNVNYLLGYRDFFNDKVVYQQAYEPGLTDTTSWVTLNNYKYDSTHKYFLYYYFLSTDSLIIDSSYREIVP